MKEKVLWFKLPEGAQYRKVIEAENGMIGIEYSEQCTCYKVKVEIPKPKALVGGGEVYQNDDVPYWYCDIKDGRDTFMHVYMEDLIEEDLLYDSKTKRKREFSTDNEMEFKDNVLKALKNKPKEGFRWIPVYEPSITPNGGVQFVNGEIPLVGLSAPEWNRILKEYSPENESGMSLETTYFLLLLRFLKDGIATLEQIADHSEEIGHYRDSKNAKECLEKTGERKFGGLYGFVGNTNKLVKKSNLKNGYSLLGGTFDFRGITCPLTRALDIADSEHFCDEASIGWLELIK